MRGRLLFPRDRDDHYFSAISSFREFLHQSSDSKDNARREDTEHLQALSLTVRAHREESKMPGAVRQPSINVAASR